MSPRKQAPILAPTSQCPIVLRAIGVVVHGFTQVRFRIPGFHQKQRSDKFSPGHHFTRYLPKHNSRSLRGLEIQRSVGASTLMLITAPSHDNYFWGPICKFSILSVVFEKDHVVRGDGFECAEVSQMKVTSSCSPTTMLLTPKRTEAWPGQQSNKLGNSVQVSLNPTLDPD